MLRAIAHGQEVGLCRNTETCVVAAAEIGFDSDTEVDERCDCQLTRREAPRRKALMEQRQPRAETDL